jgi:hypothetical protein
MLSRDARPGGHHRRQRAGDDRDDSERQDRDERTCERNVEVVHRARYHRLEEDPSEGPSAAAIKA